MVAYHGRHLACQTYRGKAARSTTSDHHSQQAQRISSMIVTQSISLAVRMLLSPGLIGLGLVLSVAADLPAADDYQLGPDSQRVEGVPKGKVTQHQWNDSQ